MSLKDRNKKESKANSNDGVERPPLGLMPRHLHEEQVRNKRFKEVSEAMKRYLEVGMAIMPIPAEWMQEYQDLIEQYEEAEAAIIKEAKEQGDKLSSENPFPPADIKITRDNQGQYEIEVFKPLSTVSLPSDKEIEDAHSKMINVSESVGFVNGAKWMRALVEKASRMAHDIKAIKEANKPWEKLKREMEEDLTIMNSSIFAWIDKSHEDFKELVASGDSKEEYDYIPFTWNHSREDKPISEPQFVVEKSKIKTEWFVIYKSGKQVIWVATFSTPHKAERAVIALNDIFKTERILAKSALAAFERATEALKQISSLRPKK